MKRTVLYEVIQKKYGKLPAHKKLGRSYRPEARRGVSSEEKTDSGSPQQQKGDVGLRPVSRKLQPLAHKRGLSVSYPVVVLLILTIIIVALGAFRLGQHYGAIEQKPVFTGSIEAKEYADTTSNTYIDILPEEIINIKGPTAPVSVPKEGSSAEEGASVPAGDHVIVIATYKQGADLVPVKKFFDENGIKTEIQERGDYFFLVTKDKFQSPRRAGTNGYYALERIKRAGANYESPQGYESFAPNLFQDAYGMKIR